MNRTRLRRTRIRRTRIRRTRLIRTRLIRTRIRRTLIQCNLYKWGSMGRAKLELAPFPGYNLYYEVLIYYLIASLFGILIN